MTNGQIEESFSANQWSSLRETMRHHVFVAKLHGAETAHQLMDTELQTFFNQPVPRNAAEVADRIREATVLAGRIEELRR